MSEFPSYPTDAAEREGVAVADAVTGEFAGWGSRVAAYLLDALILVLPLVIFFVVVVAIDPADESWAWSALGLLYLATLVLPFVYFTVMHGGGRGQTFGKRMLGIRVATQAGTPIGYGRAFGRYGVMFVLGLFVLPLLLDLLWPLWDRRNQTLHDKVARSFVVRV